MKDNANISLAISGHTDCIGNKKYNQLLSENRAKSVFDFLNQAGISSDRLAYKGYGENKPVVRNNSSTNRQKNRRVEFKIENSKD